MVLAIQIGASGGYSPAGFSPGLARGGATGATPDVRLDAPLNRGAPDTAARPGPPVARLDLPSQTQAQSAEASQTQAQSAEASQIQALSAEASQTQAPSAEASQTQAQSAEDGLETPDPQSASAEEETDTNARSAKVDEQGLTESDRRKVEQLKRRDLEVREHERAHKTAGGSITGSARYTFTRGPDGKQYAVGGEVSIDASPVPGKPDATIRKMEVVKRAALAPRNPSGQDRSVASRADAEIIKAKQELAELRREEQSDQPSQTSPEGDSIGQTDPVFDPTKRFRSAVGGASLPLGTGLAGSGELKINVGLTTPGSLFSLVA
jgi:hypothetical protein